MIFKTHYLLCVGCTVTAVCAGFCCIICLDLFEKKLIRAHLWTEDHTMDRSKCPTNICNTKHSQNEMFKERTFKPFWERFVLLVLGMTAVNIVQDLLKYTLHAHFSQQIFYCFNIYGIHLKKINK